MNATTASEWPNTVLDVIVLMFTFTRTNTVFGETLFFPKYLRLIKRIRPATRAVYGIGKKNF